MKIKELLTRYIKGNTHMVELYYEGGGEMPKAISGMYTSKTEALAAGNLYIQGRNKVRPRKNVEDAKDTI